MGEGGEGVVFGGCADVAVESVGVVAAGGEEDEHVDSEANLCG